MKLKHRKQIINNPLAAIRTYLPYASPEILDSLDKLARTHSELDASRCHVREQAGIISGQIGAAKAAGNPVDDLIRSMRDQSRRLTELDKRISKIEQSIFGYFDLQEPEADLHTEDSGDRPQGRYRHGGAPATRVTVSLLDNETGEWNNYVENHPGSSIYHRAEWRELIARTFGHGSYYCIAQDPDSRIVGILPLTRLTSLIFGDFFVSMPYFNYGGALGDSPEIECLLMKFAADKATALGVSHIEYRDVLQHDGYPVRTGKVNMVLALPDNETALWESFSSKLRSQVRRSQRENPIMHYGGIELLDDFYTVFTRNMRDLGTPVYDRNFFQAILVTFPEQSRILVATLENRPVAAGFLIGYRDKMEIPWASAIRDVNHLSINMFLYWEALRYSVNAGCRFFDFGRSTAGSGTYRFKQQWGAEPVQLYWHYWLKDKSDMPVLNPSNPKYALFIRLWKLLPLPVTKWLGPMIVKNLP
jgi:FemAB-related protein (PEP-CTERM system-associated)